MRTVKELLSKKAILKGIFPSDISFTPQEADRFLDYIIDQTVFKDHARIVKMSKAERNIRAIGLGTGDVLWPAQAFDETKYKSSLIHNLITLSTKKARGAAVVYDDDLEDNIEGQAFVDHLMKMIAAQIANELENAYYLGAAVPSGTDPKDLKDLWNGWRYRILNQTNNVTGSATILDARSTSDFELANGYIAEQNSSAPYNWEFKFSKALKKLPSKYKKLGLSNFRFFVNDQILQDYIDALAARSTVLGDQAILGKGPIHYGTVPIVACPLMPTNLPVPVSGGAETTITADAAAGQNVITVADTTAFSVGDYVWIHKSGLEYKEEIKKITAKDDVALTLTLDSNLEWAHNAADAELVTEVTLDGTDCILTHRENLIIGLQRDIKMETERDAKNERTIFYYSIRADLAIENLNAVVFIEHLKVK
jgi:hypothetical protein